MTDEPQTNHQADEASMRQAESLAAWCMDHRADERDTALVQRQLGRYPRGMVAVGARCVCGRPLAVVTRPMLPGAIPFPTTCYLTSPEAVKAVSHVEADGRMRDYNELLQSDQAIAEAYRRAHGMYLAFRHELARLLGDDESHIAGISAGGMPQRVKCLHALVAQTLVMGPGVNPIGDRVMEAVAAEFSPQVCRCSILEPEDADDKR